MRYDDDNMINLLGSADVSSVYRTMTDIVYSKLRDDILSGKLPPETSLNASKIAEQMNVSRTPVREAINRLTSFGLVTQISHRESKVASFMGDEIHEIYYVRAMLEGLAARNAAKNMDPANKELLISIAQDSERIANSGDYEAFLENNRKFHTLIYQSLKTPLIRALCEQFYIITSQYRSIGFKLENRSATVAEEHLCIAKYIYIGDEENSEKYGILHHKNTVRFIDESYGTGK